MHSAWLDQIFRTKGSPLKRVAAAALVGMILAVPASLTALDQPSIGLTLLAAAGAGIIGGLVAMGMMARDHVADCRAAGLSVSWPARLLFDMGLISLLIWGVILIVMAMLYVVFLALTV